MSRLKTSVETFTAVAVAHAWVAPDRCIVRGVTAHFSATPTTAEDFTLTLNANAGAAYDVVFYREDPVALGLVNDLVIDGINRELMAGDGIDIAYTNTDAATIGVSVYYELIP